MESRHTTDTPANVPTGLTPGTASDLERLMEDLQTCLREQRRRRTRRRVQRGAGLLLLTVVVAQFAYGGHHSFSFPFWVFFGGAAAMNNAPTQAAVRALAALRDPRSVGLLAVAYDTGDAEMRRFLAPLLVELLPQVRASQLADQGPEGPRAILKLLRLTEFTDAALPAVGELAPPGAVAEVERIAAEARQLMPLAGMDRTLELAEDCLKTLRLRAEAERLRSTLVRATEGPASPAEQLLRPAANTGTPQEQLLRPSQADDE